jgi:lysophospholipase L1-like esterase
MHSRPSRSARLQPWLLLACLFCVGVGVVAALSFASPASAQHHRRRLGVRVAGTRIQLQVGQWLATWGASPEAPVPGTPAADGFADQTIRNVVFTSVGGTMARVRFTNAFGTVPLEIGRAAIGPAGGGGAPVALAFDGRASVLIPPGGEVVSDPAALAVRALEALAVSVFLPGPTGPATEHAVARQVNDVAYGNHALDGSGSAFTAENTSWFFIDGVDVLSGATGAGTIVALGDSITDGVGSRTGADTRWPNDLARRLDASGKAAIGVVDEGIAGNRVLSDPPCCGPSAVARFQTDVAARSGAREVILLEGINDIGQVRTDGPLTAPHADVSAAEIIAGDEELIRDAHAAGLQIIGATLTPFGGSAHWTAAGELKRQQVNNWILTSGAFDGVIDFAKAVADPADPQMLDPAYDSGDHIHPNDAGYLTMANAINLTMVRRHERRAR